MESINSFFELFIDVWNKGIFGLNASEIIIGFIIFLVFYVLRSFFARFVIRRLHKIVKKTSIKTDDVIVNVIEGPLKFLPVVIGFFIATTCFPPPGINPSQWFILIFDPKHLTPVT